MSETSSKKVPWAKVGTIRKNDKGTFYAKLESNVEILIDGEVVKLNDSRTVSLQDPRKKLQTLFDKGFLSQKEFDERSETLAENAWLKYEMVVPPAKES